MNEHLGSRLDKLIKDFGLTQGEFARKLSCSPAFISEVIRGIKKPGSDFLANISETFNVSLDWLVLGRKVDPISGYVMPMIDFETFQTIALRTELVLAATKGNLTAKDMVKQLSNKELPTQHGPEFEILKHYLVSRLEEFRFIVDQYNAKSFDDSLDSISQKTLLNAVSRFNPLSKDVLLATINS